MTLFGLFRRRAGGGARPSASAQGVQFTGLDDPALLEYIRHGQTVGEYGRADALRNMAALRCVSLIAESIGMLPLNVMDNGPSKKYLTAHPAYRLLKLKPNGWQTPYEFKSQMQLNVLSEGNAYARIIWSRGLPQALIPMDPKATTAKLVGFEMQYEYTPANASPITLPANEVFHVRDLSLDGVLGMSRMRLARNALDLARNAECAAARVFKTGVMAAGAIESPKALSDQAYKRIKESLKSEYSGAENAQNLMLLEEGAKLNATGISSADAQHIENRNAQVEEVARAFGVPRPLLMMDDTSWGSGIEQLGIFFVQYGLQHWFTAWEQAAKRSLLSDAELGSTAIKFNERALLRGTLTDQAKYFSSALGAGGTAPWQTQNEVRGLSDLPASGDPEADKLRNPMTQKATSNEPAKTP